MEFASGCSTDLISYRRRDEHINNRFRWARLHGVFVATLTLLFALGVSPIQAQVQDLTPLVRVQSQILVFGDGEADLAIAIDPSADAKSAKFVLILSPDVTFELSAGIKIKESWWLKLDELANLKIRVANASRNNGELHFFLMADHKIVLSHTSGHVVVKELVGQRASPAAAPMQKAAMPSPVPSEVAQQKDAAVAEAQAVSTPPSSAPQDGPALGAPMQKAAMPSPVPSEVAQQKDAAVAEAQAVSTPPSSAPQAAPALGAPMQMAAMPSPVPSEAAQQKDAAVAEAQAVSTPPSSAPQAAPALGAPMQMAAMPSPVPNEVAQQKDAAVAEAQATSTPPSSAPQDGPALGAPMQKAAMPSPVPSEVAQQKDAAVAEAQAASTPPSSAPQDGPALGAPMQKAAMPSPVPNEAAQQKDAAVAEAQAVSTPPSSAPQAAPALGAPMQKADMPSPVPSEVAQQKDAAVAEAQAVSSPPSSAPQAAPASAAPMQQVAVSTPAAQLSSIRPDPVASVESVARPMLHARSAPAPTFEQVDTDRKPTDGQAKLQTSVKISNEAEAKWQFLLDSGARQIAQGNVAVARQYFLRAAETGSAIGALKLAETYDPNELFEVRVYGLRADVQMARRWYERAAQLGVGEAAVRLHRLDGN